MKFKSISKLAAIIAVVFMLSSCSARLVDFTVISSKNVALKFDKSQGKQVEGKSIKFFAPSIKEAIDNALEKAGPSYDMLVDGVVSQVSYIVIGGFKVKGIAINSSKLKAELGEKGFENWCKSQNILDPTTAKVQN